MIGADGQTQTDDVTQSKTIYLHVGLPKTGSTHIQERFHQARALLRRNGLHYPVAGERYAGHHTLAKAFASTPADRGRLKWIPTPDREQLLSQLHEELAASPAEKVFISSEAFGQLDDIQPIAEALGNYQIKILMFIRRQDLWLESLYNQHAKLYVNCRTPEAFLAQMLENQGFDYRLRLEKWSLAFGERAIVPIPFERSQFTNGDLAQTLLQHLNFGLELPEGAGKQFNESLSPAALAYLRRLPCKEKQRLGPVHEHLRRALSAYSGKHDPTPASQRRFYSPAQRQSLLEQCRESNADVARRYLRRDSGQLFLEEFSAQEEEWAPYPGLTDTQFAAIAEFVFRHLARQMTPAVKSPDS